MKSAEYRIFNFCDRARHKICHNLATQNSPSASCFLLLNLRQCLVPLRAVNQIPVHLGVDPHAHAQL